MEALFQDGCTSMFLEVRQSNAPAQGLYRKLGYEALPSVRITIPSL